MKKIALARRSRLLAGHLGRARPRRYPQRPITMIVPFAAGGPTDVIARIVGDNMSRTLGQQIVVENVAGAGGTTGITRGAQAAAGRLHDHDGPHGHPRRGAGALSEPQIRSGQGFRPDRPCGRHADRDRRQEGFPGQGPERFRRVRAEERRQGEHGPCGRRARCRIPPASSSIR